MFRKALYVLAIATSSTLSIGAGSAFAMCPDFVGVEQNGIGNQVFHDSWGRCNYSSSTLDGDWNASRHRVGGDHNAQVNAQFGYGHVFNSDVHGRRINLGSVQTGNHTRADVSISGVDHGVALYQHRSGSRVAVKVNGIGGSVVIRSR